jgi:hypothetical protein
MDYYTVLRFLHFVGFILLGGGFGRVKTSLPLSGIRLRICSCATSLRVIEPLSLT